MAELKDPKEFPKALALLQSIDMTLYIVAVVVIYRYTGVDVASPALGSAGPLISRIAYGIALPTVGLPSSSLHNSDAYFEDCHCWSHQRSCCSQITLHPHLCWHGPDAQQRLGRYGLLDRDRIRPLGHRMGHR